MGRLFSLAMAVIIIFTYHPFINIQSTTRKCGECLMMNVKKYRSTNQIVKWIPLIALAIITVAHADAIYFGNHQRS